MCPADKEVFSSFAHAQVSLTNEIYQYVGEPETFLFCPTGMSLLYITSFSIFFILICMFICCFCVLALQSTVVLSATQMSHNPPTFRQLEKNFCLTLMYCGQASLNVFFELMNTIFTVKPRLICLIVIGPNY